MCLLTSVLLPDFEEPALSLRALNRHLTLYNSLLCTSCDFAFARPYPIAAGLKLNDSSCWYPTLSLHPPLTSTLGLLYGERQLVEELYSRIESLGC